MGLSNDQIVSGENLQWMAFSGLTAAFYFWRCAARLHSVDWNWKKAVEREAFILMAGILLVSAGSFVHRGYWALWRYYRAIGETEAAEWFVAGAAPLTGVCVVMICLGYAFHLYPVSKSLFGRAWPVAETVVFVGSFLFGAYAPWLFPAPIF